jgi:hypothetical protein
MFDGLALPSDTMSGHNSISYPIQYSSIVLLWAFTESGLGGILHAFSIPFSGVLLGGMSAFCLFLLADGHAKPVKQIGRAWIVVMAVKYTVSPHSPLGAYLAMSIQTAMAMGILGFLSFTHWRFRLGVMTFLNIMLSAVQKIFVLTLIFGMSLWDGIDKFLNGVLKTFGVTNEYPYASWLVGLYFAIYFISAIAVIFILFRTIGLSRTLGELPPLPDTQALPKKKHRRKYLLFILFLFIPLVFVLLGEWSRALYVLGRSVLVIALGWLVLLPLLRHLLKRLKKNAERENAGLLSDTLDGLPKMRAIAQQAFALSKINGRPRISYFLAYVIAYLSQTENE